MTITTNDTTTRSRRETLADFAALCALLITAISIAILSLLGPGQDFRGYYAAGSVLAAGGNPYDYAQVSEVLVRVTGWAGNNPFYYPLWFGWFFAPLAFLPYQAARAVWIFFNLAVWIVELARLGRWMNWPPSGWRSRLMGLLATFLFAWTTLKFEQAGILLFALLVEILIAHADGRRGRLGILLALALIKPNITLLPIALLVLWLVRNRQFRPVVVMAAALAGLVLLTSLLTPGWYRPILQQQGFGSGLTRVLDGPSQVTGIRLTTTLTDWLKGSRLPGELRAPVYGLVVLAGMAVGVLTERRSRSMPGVMSISLLVSFLISPYAMQYDFPPLTIVLFWLVMPSRNTADRAVPAAVMAFLASVLFWERPVSDGYWMVIGLGILLTWSLYSRGRYPFRGRLRPSFLHA